MALTALRPFVRLSQRLERQTVPVPAPEPPVPPAAAPAPRAEEPAHIAPTPPTAARREPTPAPEPAPPTTAVVAGDGDAEVAPAADAATGTDQFQDVDASVVPVPIESLNRLVLAVDELGSEMTHVRQAIRELTQTLSESQAGFARILAGQAANGVATPDPLAAVSGPYVSGSPSPTPFTAPPEVGTESSAPAAAFDPASLTAAAPATEAPAPAFSFPDPVAPPAGAPAPEHANGFGDLPIVHTGDAQVVIGPISSLDELDDAVDHIRRINGVDTVSVTSFEGAHVVLTAELSRALPLASLLRTDLGRDVASCRAVDGRIVVEFSEAGRRS